MLFKFTDEQAMLGASLAGTLSRGGVAAMMDLGAGQALLAEIHGGLGGSGVDIMMVFQTLGHEAAVTDLLDSVVLGAGILAEAGDIALASEAAAGAARIAVALDQSEGGAPVVEHGLLTGPLSIVQGAETASHLIVETAHEVYLISDSVPDLVTHSYPLMAGGRASEVALARTPARRLGGRDLTERPRAAAILAVCADALGAMDRVLELTTQYLKVRHQFGRPIAGFQGLRHRMADLVTEVEQARSAVWNLATHLDLEDRARHVAATKSLVGRTALLVAEEAIQLHGGIGMTEEYDLAPLARRLLAADARFGDSDHHLHQFITMGTV